MKLGIFPRLALGYLIVFTLAAAASIYAIIRLYQFNDVTDSLLKTEQRLIADQAQLVDAMLAQVRFERKFILTKDQALRNQFLESQRDFNRQLHGVYAVARSPEVRDLLKDTEKHYQRYRTLFSAESERLMAGGSYDQEQFRQGKQEAVDKVLEVLKALKSHAERSASGKIAKLDEFGANAIQVATVLVGASLFFGIVVSLLITERITRPISILKEKTKRIAGGDFRDGPEIASPPEIEELSRSFNLMCARLSELDKMKSDFFSTMSHELRTPLTSIKEGISLLRQEPRAATIERNKKILTILAEESDRLIALVNSLLDLAKMEAGMMSYHFEQAQLPSLIDQVIFAMTPLAEAKSISLDSRTNGGMPPVRVDSERILQCLRNLIGNAVKFTPEGGKVSIIARAVDRGVEVAVADTGPGIAAGNLPTIFDKFEQADSAGPNRSKGTGLGLAIAKHIITSHHGKIWVESEPGRGSRFIFVLPA